VFVILVGSKVTFLRVLSACTLKRLEFSEIFASMAKKMNVDLEKE